MTDLIIGKTYHCRYHPKKHSFTYPLYMLCMDVKKLSFLNSKFLLGYNKPALLSVYDSDYLQKNDNPLHEKINQLNQSMQCKDHIHYTKLVTIPRFIFKTFRPVGFYLCYDKHNRLLGMFAEVTNTYKEAYFYKVEPDGNAHRVIVDKAFHVSPFFEEKGQYLFDIIDNNSKFEVHITYKCDQKTLFYANFIGNKKALTTLQLFKLCFSFPLTALLVYPRILFQAFCLSFVKKIRHYSKPPLPSKNVLRHMPLSFFQKKVLHRIAALFNNKLKGYLTLKFNHDQSLEFGHKNKELNACIKINHPRFFNNLHYAGEIGLGESFIKNDWESTDLCKVLMLFLKNIDVIDTTFSGNRWVGLYQRCLHALRKNSIQNSKKNISMHYDLGNDFYNLFLDSSMLYSAAYYQNGTETLHDAQVKKVHRLLDPMTLHSNDHVLEIGSGWGFTACEIAKRFSCKVTSITLSKKQQNYAKNYIKSQGLEHLVDVKIQDYRHCEGKFSAIVSIEMIEAVGHEYLETFFKQCSCLLKAGGIFALQAITYPDDKYEQYCKRSDFIRQYIFPGGHLPSKSMIHSIVSSKTNLIAYDEFNINKSYAKTLNEWRKCFTNKKKQVLALGFDEFFIRKWIYYLAYCEVGFESDYLGCYQFHFKKQGTD